MKSQSWNDTQLLNDRLTLINSSFLYFLFCSDMLKFNSLKHWNLALNASIDVTWTESSQSKKDRGRSAGYLKADGKSGAWKQLTVKAICFLHPICGEVFETEIEAWIKLQIETETFLKYWNWNRGRRTNACYWNSRPERVLVSPYFSLISQKQRSNCWVRVAVSTWNISRLWNTAKKWL